MTSEPSCQPSHYLPAGDRQAVRARYSTETFYVEECDVGLGVFANRDIRAGEPILNFGGPVIDFAETKRRGKWECMPLQIGHNRYYDTQPPGIFVNHSCHPNAGIRRDRELIALRDIRKGDEIRFDYSTTMEEHSFTMNCCCGELRCRQVIGDFSALPSRLQEHYIAQGIVMSFIVNKVRPAAVPMAASEFRATPSAGRVAVLAR